MYLKALEIHGFKSFPDRTRLVFEKPVTAIVGPNGSGKSNISDAISWVMGEQSSKSLRGSKMEDVIFGGTEKRKQMGFAEVTLVIDNSENVLKIEASEVSITRRYYRSGESEYYINRENVRLKDINELLMDTGLGRDGYSIIGQGKIDDILSAHSVDRREIFEEAAGISRFRHRKEDAERELSRTEDSLLRINDKISELELQVTPLREQAKAAKKYLLLRDKLRETEVSVWIYDLKKLEDNSAAICCEYNDIVNDIEILRSDLTIAQKKYDDLHDLMYSKDVDAEHIREEIAAIEASKAELEGALAVAKSNLQHNADDIARVRCELAEQEQRGSGLSMQIEEREKRIFAIDSEKAEKEALLIRCEAELNEISELAVSSADTFSTTLAKEAEISEQLGSARENLSALALLSQELNDRDSVAAGEVLKVTERLNNTKAERNKNACEIREAANKVQAQKNILSGHNIKVENKKKKSAELNEKLTQLKIEINSIVSRFNMLSEMEKEYQGYSKAVKIVMQESARGTLQNIYGTVGSRVETEDIYAIAVETALGASVQNIIVGSEEDGKAAINMLRHRDGGRATFLPMATIHGSSLKIQELCNEIGFVGVALELVKFDERFRGIYTSLLGHTAVADDLDSAIRISRKYKNRFRIVTLDGQIINAGGSMTGGSAARNIGIISRANELKHLAVRRDELKKAAEQTKAERDNAERELAVAEYELQIAAGSLRESENILLRLQSDEKHFDELIESIEIDLSAKRKDVSSLKEKIEANDAEIAAERSNISDLEKLSDEIKEQMKSISSDQQLISGQRDEINRKIISIKGEISALEAELGATEKAMRELSKLMQSMSDSCANQVNLLDEMERQKSGIVEQIDHLKHSAVAASERIEEQKNKLSEVSAERLDIEAQRTKISRIIQEKNNSLLSLQQKESKLEQKKITADMQEKQIVDKLWDNYGLTRSEAGRLSREIEDMQVETSKLAELKKEIAGLGNPNIGAIEEYERVNTRYSFFTEQRDDIEKSKNELLNIIGDITLEMTDIFKKEFADINKSFSETFSELFEGGHASLVLEDVHDVLNCGIEIKVQPPGKTLKTLTLLSGGEKAFVAIALYFAILKVRPTPFCVMDEIEAALDETNVLKCAGYMRRMANKTQFIVITHRRGTMEEADVLYGVTMQEQGVSRLINVDLESAEKIIVSDP